MAGVVDRCDDQYCRAAVVVQARLEAEVLDDAGDDALLALAGAHQLLHRRPALAQHRLLEVVQTLGLLLKPLVDGRPRGQPLRHVACLVLKIENDAVGHALVELVGVDVGAEDVARHQLVFAQERRAGEADEDRALQPALHLLVHVAALGAVALVHEHVEAALNGRRRAFQVGRVELVDERAQQARRGRPELLHELRPRGDARRRRIGADDPGVLHHALDLLVQLVAVGDDEDARLGVVLQQPLGEQHHQDALAAALGVPDDAALALGDAFLRGLHSEELVRPRHFLLAGVEDDEVADQVEQPRLVA